VETKNKDGNEKTINKSEIEERNSRQIREIYVRERLNAKSKEKEKQKAIHIYFT